MNRITTTKALRQTPKQHAPRNRRRRRSAFNVLRLRYFAHAGVMVSRYGIAFDRVVQHLWDVRRRRLLLPLRSIAHVDDLVHAIGCVDDCARAWHDLIELYEPWLVRRCRDAVGPMTAVLEVRQLVLELRRREANERAEVSLHDYLGVQPLRLWLAMRLQDRLEQQAPSQQPPRGIRAQGR